MVLAAFSGVYLRTRRFRHTPHVLQQNDKLQRKCNENISLAKICCLCRDMQFMPWYAVYAIWQCLIMIKKSWKMIQNPQKNTDPFESVIDRWTDRDLYSRNTSDYTACKSYATMVIKTTMWFKTNSFIIKQTRLLPIC